MPCERRLAALANALDGECLLAVIGVDNVLNGKATLHKYQLQEAAALPRKIRQIMLRFLATDDVDPAKDYPEYDYAELGKMLAHGQTPEQAASLQAAVPDPELAQELGVHANSIQTWGNSVFPRETRETIRGPVQEDPAPSTWSDFCRIWQVAVDPMTVMRDLAEGCLSEEQVTVAIQHWPALYAEMRQASVEGLASSKREVTERKTAQLHILRQETAFDAELAAAVQASYAQSMQGQAPPKPGISADDTKAGDLTPGQKAANG
jgi:hypothetical protein